MNFGCDCVGAAVGVLLHMEHGLGCSGGGFGGKASNLLPNHRIYLLESRVSKKPSMW